MRYASPFTAVCSLDGKNTGLFQGRLDYIGLVVIKYYALSGGLNSQNDFLTILKAGSCSLRVYRTSIFEGPFP